MTTAATAKLSTLVIHDGVVWGWAFIPGRYSVDVHLYFDGRHVASEVTGQPLPASLQRRCGTAPRGAGAFCFALPPDCHDGFEHTLQAALPQIEDGGLYSVLLTLPAAAARGEVGQQWRLLVGTVWFDTPSPRQRELVISDDRGRVLSKKKLQPSALADPKGYAATFSIPLTELSPGKMQISCAGQQLRGSPLMPVEFLVGALEVCSSEAISGWAFNGLDPLKPIELALRIDGKVVLWFRPNMMRTDLAEQLSLPDLAMGIAGFHLQPPALLFDGLLHCIEVVSAADGQWLAEGKHYVRWPPTGKKVLPVRPGKIKHSKRTFPAPIVSVVILNRNGARVLEPMLASWEKYNRAVAAELIVIDHASTDESLALLKYWQLRLDLKIVPLKQNDSFSASSNRGAAMARGEYVLFMNNDIQWLHDALPSMLSTLHDPNVGIVGMKLLKVVGESQARKQYASEVQHLGVRFTLNEHGYWPFELKPGVDEEEYSSQQVPVVTGAALLCRKHDFDAVGGFHTDYFYGFEDVELCVRLTQRLNKQVICRNDCVALHHHGHTRLSGRERSIFDRLIRNSTVLEAHIGLWMKREWWRCLLRGNGLYTREVLRIGLVGIAAELAPSLQQTFAHAEIVLLTSDDDWKRVANIHLLAVGDRRYDIRSLTQARADLLAVAWVRDGASDWSRLPWWHDFAAVLVPAKVAPRMQKSLQLPVLASTPSQAFGSWFDTTLLRIIIRGDFTSDDCRARAVKLRNHLRREGASCWLQDAKTPYSRVTDVCVTLNRKVGKHASVTVADGMLQVSQPTAAPLLSAAWLREELEKQVGSTFQSS